MKFIVAIGAAVIYVGLCAGWPYTRCRLCRGVGGRAGKTLVLRRTVTRDCRWCGASGLRLRWGRRAYNHFARIRRDAERAAR